ncbi:MAG TPA: hypothetical protein PKG71_00970 [Candidatus Woesebacteria bacterium]|nr:hypothetical protein [Candidatus Woesebacteria bacterium]HNS94518.1 hypothetical protein [Candidatus Woesebacteria bacterium]
MNPIELQRLLQNSPHAEGPRTVLSGQIFPAGRQRTIVPRKVAFALGGLSALALGACSGPVAPAAVGIAPQPIAGEPGLPSQVGEQATAFSVTETPTRKPIRTPRPTRTPTRTSSPTRSETVTASNPTTTPRQEATPTSTTAQTHEALGIEQGIIPVIFHSEVSKVGPAESTQKIFTDKFIQALADSNHLQPIMGSTSAEVLAYLQSHNGVLPPQFLIPQHMEGAFHDRVEYATSDVPVNLSQGVSIELRWGGPQWQNQMDYAVWSGNQPGLEGIGWSVDDDGQLSLSVFIKGNNATIGNPNMQVAVATMMTNVALETLGKMKPIDMNAPERLGLEYVNSLPKGTTNWSLLERQGLFDTSP